MKTVTTLITAILLFVQCAHNASTDEVETGTIIENADLDKLSESISGLSAQITDSGTLHGQYLNEPDTVRILLSGKPQIQRWLKYILRKENVDYPLFFARKAALHGLDENYYHASYLEKSTFSIKNHRWDTANKIPYDSLAMHLLYAADACLGVFHDMSCGRANSDYHGSIDALPRRTCRSVYRLFLGDSLVTHVAASFPRFHPYVEMQSEYERLMGFTRDMLGPQLSYSGKIKQGDTMGKAAVALAKKLRLHGALPIHDTLIAKKRIFDPELATAVSDFRLKQGLDPIPLLDKQTVELLNTTYTEMLQKLKVNLERWRWLGDVALPSRVWVNIAENTVYAWQNDTLKLRMKVCSGKNRDDAYYQKLEKSKTDKSVTSPDNLETPLFRAEMKYIVARPTWHVPRNIMTKEILPMLKKDPAYLANHNYKLYNWKGEELNPFSINWKEVSPDKWKYRIEQQPGDDNALGEVVIQFPNSYSIYMHDTPSKYAFSRDFRHVSHGCVRMEQPLKMVEFLTGFNKTDNYDRILVGLGHPPEHDTSKNDRYRRDMKDSLKAQKMLSKPNTYYKIDNPVPVFLVYFTAFLNTSNGVQYIQDGYKRDELAELLKKPSKRKAIIPVIPESAVQFSP